MTTNNKIINVCIDSFRKRSIRTVLVNSTIVLAIFFTLFISGYYTKLIRKSGVHWKSTNNEIQEISIGQPIADGQNTVAPKDNFSNFSNSASPSVLNKSKRTFVFNPLGNARNSIEYYEKSNYKDQMTYGDTHLQVAKEHKNVGFAWYSIGEYQKAIEHYGKALVIDLQILGEMHPEVARDYNNLGFSWYSLGEYQKSIFYYEKALAIDLSIYRELHPQVALRYNNLGIAWKRLNKYKKAMDYFQKAFFIFDLVFGSSDTHTRDAKQSIESLRNIVNRG